MESSYFVTKDANVAITLLKEGKGVMLDLSGMSREESDAVQLEFQQQYDKMVANEKPRCCAHFYGGSRAGAIPLSPPAMTEFCDRTIHDYYDVEAQGPKKL